MQLGLIGMPMTGKTTLFELLTKTTNKAGNQGKANTAIAKVPDQRIDYLSGIYNPKKTIYAQLELVDIPGLVPGNEKGSNVFLDSVRRADALLHVVRAFDNGFEEPDPLGDMQNISYELLLADLDLVEKRLERIMEGKKKNQDPKEIALLEKLKEVLSTEKPLSSLELDDEEKTMLSSFQFLTLKPMLICLNVSEDAIISHDYPGRDEALSFAREQEISVVEVAASIEREIAELEGEEKEEFMEEMGIDEAGLVKICRSMYESLGLISFFTVGEDEVRAWPIEKGISCRKAAGRIHSDIERGFIRAEVVAYDDFCAAGSMAAVKERGQFRLEGKEYIVKDGDIAHFRFNV